MTALPAGVHARVAQFIAPSHRHLLGIVTPEGVRLEVEIATFGERAGAYLIDLTLIFGINIVLALCVVLAIGAGLRTPLLHGHARLVFALTGLIGFLVRSLYFARFELVWQGTTPGKRANGLRVIDRHGGPLLPGAVITRNVTREAEVFLPLTAFLAAPSANLAELSLFLWVMLLALLPLFTPERMRAGDMLAGTVVIALPRRILLPDLVVEPPALHFADRHLRSYGIFELQVLEEVLRRPESAATDALRRDICARVCRRIDWADEPTPENTHDFLRQFYAAQRSFLERELLFGRARENKEKAGGFAPSTPTGEPPGA
jgi:uncharacterized RDD family membrane protein YckC